MPLKIIACITILVLVKLVCADELDYLKINNSLGDRDVSKDSTKILSRRKRYLTFPDGSSFQLVICTQNHGYIQVGDIVWFGNTAALAWELPSDPQFFYKVKEYEGLREFRRRQDTSRHIYYLDDKGKVIGKVPYRKRPIVNPAFAKRSVDGENMKQISINEMHSMQASKNVLENLDEDTIDFHRKGRRDFYVKLESFFDALGLNGKECVLRLLCETGKGKADQGSFLEEIMRATFTLPQGREFESQQHKHYDVAHGTDGECGKTYPNCEDIHGFQLFEQ